MTPHAWCGLVISGLWVLGGFNMATVLLAACRDDGFTPGPKVLVLFWLAWPVFTIRNMVVLLVGLTTD